MALPAFGARATGPRLERMQASPQWRDGHFHDPVPRGAPSVYGYLRRQIGWAAISDWLFRGSKHRIPHEPVTYLERSKEEFGAKPRSGLRLTWLGHSTMLLELDGVRLLTDPVLNAFAGPMQVMGQRRFFPSPMAVDALPETDLVVLSHDHYDHLDYPTILALAKTRAKFIAPLGVGAHLEAWGIEPARITELDWWEEHRFRGLTLTATPARHFSGRGVMDLEHTLWAGIAIAGSKHRVFYSGDTAMFPGLTDIGRRLGPFDVTLVEAGAYSRHWADIHLGPEQAVDAHRMVLGDVMVPVHWGLFDLAMHGWTEPIERVLVAAQKHGTRVATPRPGESFELDRPLPSQRWWPDLPWETAEESPIVSTGMGETGVGPLELDGVGEE
ncbi:MAG: MBL fold metallo-hydrolase [Myxococcales bacterium]|nr:MBL fold metallo-hydrolase [Myxococcales bacterium]